MTKKDLRYIVREIINEVYSNVEEAGGSHVDAKEMRKSLNWIKNNLEGITIEDVKNGYRICPPKELSDDCFTAHRGGKGIYDLYRFLSSAYSISKHEIENAVSSNRKLNLLAIDLPTIKLGKKIWYIDKDNEELILTRNINRKKSFYDLEEEELDKVITAI